MNPDTYKKESIVFIEDKEIVVNLKWLKGTGRYYNGATIYGNRYNLRLILSRAKALLPSIAAI